MIQPKIDVIIPTARWESRPRDLLADLGRELPAFNESLGEVLVADGESVHFAKADVLRTGPAGEVPAPSQTNGPAVNRNKAIDHATADFIVFLDDDVRLVPGWGEHLSSLLGRSGKFDLLGGAIVARHGRNWFSQAAEDFVIRHKLQPDGWYLAAAHLVARRSSITLLGGFDEAFIYGGEDWDLCKRAHMLGMSVGVTDFICVVHDHPTTWAQLMRKADQYGPAEVGLSVYSEVSEAPAPVEEQRAWPGLIPVVRTVGRALRWPFLQYGEFRGIGRSRVRSVRSTALYVPWMARYLQGRRATGG